MGNTDGKIEVCKEFSWWDSCRCLLVKPYEKDCIGLSHCAEIRSGVAVGGSDGNVVARNGDKEQAPCLFHIVRSG